MSDVRVRFAPSPTGYLHIGGARTALCNWLWARHHGGKFVLRIEDTDRERSTEESIQVIFDSMRWLGLDWDEGPGVGGPHGPYLQTERLGIYAEFTEKLIAAGHGYRCYATKEEIQQAREEYQQATGRKEGFRFQSPWRNRKDELDRPHVIRFKAPADGSTGWNDLVRGHIEYPNDQLQDSVVVRGDGVPLYNFGAVVDDLTMGINLVARGDDHMVNTPIQILLYEALGGAPPQLAHLPMILAPNGQKLSKRHAAVSVLDYRDAGYLADGVLNYLARLGWSHGDQEVFRREELIEHFDWAHVGRTGARYDAKKFEYVQAEHLRMRDDGELAAMAVPFLAERGLEVKADDPRLRAALPYLKPRATTLKDLAEAADYFFREPPAFDDKARAKFLQPERAAILMRLAEAVGAVEPFDVATLDTEIKAWLDREGIAMKDMAQPARVALSGRTQSPGLFEVMAVLGKATTLARLENAAGIARGDTVANGASV